MTTKGRYEVKALSVKQPWANMIRDGLKTIETRTWRTSYRGQLLIVSSKKPDLENFPEMLVSEEASGPYGRAVAVVRLAGCRTMRYTDQVLAGCNWYEGAVAWLLADIRRLKPFPVRGRHRLFAVDITETPLEYLKGATS